ncbi:hypothetical protein DA2_1719 [Desulfovibrio sp. A2]|nr:hypothetical protein DA2_1719 [Desulfovibrio sp. A2]
MPCKREILTNKFYKATKSVHIMRKQHRSDLCIYSLASKMVDT